MASPVGNIYSSIVTQTQSHLPPSCCMAHAHRFSKTQQPCRSHNRTVISVAGMASPPRFSSRCPVYLNISISRYLGYVHYRRRLPTCFRFLGPETPPGRSKRQFGAAFPIPTVPNKLAKTRTFCSHKTWADPLPLQRFSQDYAANEDETSEATRRTGA